MIPIAFMNIVAVNCSKFSSRAVIKLVLCALCCVLRDISLSEKMAVIAQNHPYPTEGSYWKEVCHQVTEHLC